MVPSKTGAVLLFMRQKVCLKRMVPPRLQIMVSRTGVYGLRFSGSAHLVLRVHAQSLQAPASDQIYAEAPNECLTKAATEPDQNYQMRTLWGPRRCSIVFLLQRSRPQMDGVWEGFERVVEVPL